MSTTNAAKPLVALALLAIALLVALPLLFGGFGAVGMGTGFGMGPGGGMGPGTGPGSGPGTGSGALPLWAIVATLGLRVFALLVVVLVGYYLYGALAGSTTGDPALDELRRAYARGDLSDEEFEHRRDRLREE